MMEKEKRKESKQPIKSARAANKARVEGISTPQEAEVTSGPVGAKKRTRAENGKVLIVDSVGNVFLEEETEEGDTQEFLLDVSTHLRGMCCPEECRADCVATSPTKSPNQPSPIPSSSADRCTSTTLQLAASLTSERLSKSLWRRIRIRKMNRAMRWRPL